MFFAKHHPEDKRMFGILLVGAIIIFAIFAYGLIEFTNTQRKIPVKPTSNELQEVGSLMLKQQQELSTQALGESTQMLNELYVLESMKEQIEAQQ